MKIVKRAYALALLLLSVPFAVRAQQGELYLVHREKAVPSQVGAFESTMKELIGQLRSHETGFPFFRTVMFEDLSYGSVAIIPSLADVALPAKAFSTLAQQMGEAKFADFWRRSGAATEGWHEVVLRERPDLSFRPEKPLAMAEIGAYRFEYFYPLVGHELELEAVAKQWAALSKASGDPAGFIVYEVVLGLDAPGYVASFPGRSESDLAKAAEDIRKLLGAKYDEQWTKTASLLRRYDVEHALVRPDLSYLPAAR